MFTIKLRSVYSRLGTTVTKNGRRLSVHQEETIAAVLNPEVEVVFNTAMTGDGKSLAAYYPVLTRNDFPTIGLYPTNELSRDQFSQLGHYVEQFSTTEYPPHRERITGDLLRECEAHQVTRQRELLNRLKHEVVVSNPDIYHYIFNLYYRKKTDNPDKVFAEAAQRFKLTVFDEFHVFQAPQITSVINTLLLIRRVEGIGKRKFLFLSATPIPHMLQAFERVGITCRHVTGDYQHGADVEGTVSPENGWRRILQETSLCFAKLEGDTGTAEKWIKARLESHVIPFFRAHPGSKGAIIVNSVAAAKRLTGWLRGKLTPLGLTVESNTGFDSATTRSRSFAADVLVGTSTIDVGVDFKINFLVFEATDAGSFIQRLGRLGRHAEVEREQGLVRFTAFQAYALLPSYVVERLFQNEAGTLLRDGETYDRTVFTDIIRQEAVFPTTEQFPAYARRWGSLQAAHIHMQLTQRTVKSAYEGILPQLDADYEKAQDRSMRQAIGCLASYCKTEDGKLIFQEAQSFRGTSPLLCAVEDETERNPEERFKTYNLPGLIANWDTTEVLTKAEFLRRAEASQVSPERFTHCFLFVKVGALREERTNWHFYVKRSLGVETCDLKAMNGLHLESRGGRIEYLDEINGQLKKQVMVGFLVRGTPQETKIRRRLPAMFAVYPLADEDSLGDKTPPYSIAFGQEALQLASLYWQKSTAQDGAVVVC